MTRKIINIAAASLISLVSACGGGSSTETSTEPPKAAAIPVTTPSEGAHRFLEQTTFGPSIKELDRVSDIGFEAWINEQMAKPATLMLPMWQAIPDPRWSEYVNIWWRNTVFAEDQLRQRVAFALSEIFVISADSGLGDEQAGLSNYYDILVRNAFGNYRDLLTEVTLSPVMGEFLSMKGNQKPDEEENIRPDENYARELLQLFSIGLSQLNPDGSPKIGSDGREIPTYTQETIEQFAHVFTGWHFSNADHYKWPKLEDYINPMVPYEEYHDTGSKTLLRGKVLPAGQTAKQDLSAALTNIFNHPNVGPFISKQLIQRLVTSNPSPTYIQDIAAVFDANENGERGNLGSVIKALLLHDEARGGHLTQPETFGKLKEPVFRITSLWRAFPPDRMTDDFSYSWSQSDIGQAVLNAPSVFNFFRPGFSQPGAISERGLVSPEFQLHDESSIIKITSRLLSTSIHSHNYQYESDQYRLAINISREVALEEKDPELMIQHLDDLLLGGDMSDALRSEVRNVMQGYDYESGGPQRVVEAIFLIIASPESAIQI